MPAEEDFGGFHQALRRALDADGSSASCLRPSRPSRSPASPSAISSPAPDPAMPTPSTRPVFLSSTSLVSPSGRSTVIGAAQRAPWELRDLDVAPLGLRLRLGQSRPCDLRIGEHDRRNRERLEHRAMSLDRLRRPRAPRATPCARASARPRRRRSRRWSAPRSGAGHRSR